MRRATLLLILATVCAVAHVVGVLTAAPLWRGAEVLSLALLLAYAVAAGLPPPRWAVPVALAPLIVDAVRTMPADPGSADTGWMVYGGDRVFDSTADGTALFAWYAITPTRTLPQPVPALVAVVELAAYLLLVAGLTGADRAAPAVPARAESG
ncbi:hypothetical protein [Micromonospora sp. NPDC049203]|uniref:hypothetical protein n=1 Tax=Micromonospora sp. NPDC049203 TaxID=3364267 RepID=UPI00371CD02D